MQRFELSHPSWVCGLKQAVAFARSKPSLVTPFVGVWIETQFLRHHEQPHQVTPFVGVWIETRISTSVTSSPTSHTLRGCVD